MRIGIIGTGSIADAHMWAYRAYEGAEIVAGADIVPGKAEEFIKKKEVKGAVAYTDYREMIEKENLDAVSVCTYNTSHSEPAAYALRHGVPVLLEKPFADTFENALEVLRAERETGVTLSIGFQPRFNPNNIMITEKIREGILGDVYYIRTGGGRRYGIPGGRGSTFIRKDTAGVGAMGDIGCYSLDLVLHPLGYPKPVTVSAYTSDFFGKSREFAPDYITENFEVEDFAAAFIRFETGMVMDFVISWGMHLDSMGDTVLLGKKAAMRIPSTECWNGGPGGPVTIYTQRDGQEVNEQLPFVENRRDEFVTKVATFLDAVKEGKPGPVQASEIIINQAIIDAVMKSAKEGREIEVNLPEDI